MATKTRWCLLASFFIRQCAKPAIKHKRTEWQDGGDDARRRESLGDRNGLAWQLGNVGSVYRDKEEHLAALESYSKALAIFEEQDESIGMADQYSNIGYIHAMKRERETALEWFQKAKALYDSLGQDRKASLAQQNIQLLTSTGNT